MYMVCICVQLFSILLQFDFFLEGLNYNSVQYCDYERNFVCITKFLLVFCFKATYHNIENIKQERFILIVTVSSNINKLFANSK